MPIDPQTDIPDNFGSGHAHLAPGGSQGSPNLRDILREHKAALEQLDADGAGGLQAGVATLAAGTADVGTTIVLAAGSQILLTWAERPTGSANIAGLAVVARTSGAAGVAEFTIEALQPDGAIDVDAVGDVSWLIVG